MKSAAAPPAGAGRGQAPPAPREDGETPAAGSNERGAVIVILVAAVLLAAWVLVYPKTPDLAGQVYRVDLFSRSGMVVWDGNWYAGHHMPGYSLLFPPLAALLGIRVVGVLAVLASVAMFDRIAVAAAGPRAHVAAAWFAVAAAGDVWAGRVTFALGLSVALAAVLAHRRGLAAAAGALSAASAAASPVAGALLALAGLTLALHERAVRPLLVLGAPALAVVFALAGLFPEGGTEPYPILSFAATAVVVALVLAALPRPGGLALMGAGLYLLVCAACLLIHTPVGSNVERYGVLFAAPLLLCAVPAAGARLTPLAATALAAAAVWMLWGPVRETAAVAGSPATTAAYYAPVKAFVAALGAPVRLEVPLTRSHWEAALLAPAVPLARGWEKQFEERYDRVLLRPGLDAASYRAWLAEQAVSYVALPDAQLDPSSAQEGRLIRAGLPYLAPVMRSAHWVIYRVLGATPLAAGPGAMTALGHDSFTVRARSAGAFLVRVHYTRYFTVTAGRGCVSRAAGGWTELNVGAAGPVKVSARFSLARAVGGAGSCSGK